MPYLFLALFGSAILLLCINLGRKKRSAGWTVGLGLLVASACFLCAPVPILSTSAFLIGITGCFFTDRRCRIIATSIVATCPYLLLIGAIVMPEVIESNSYRNRYPIESLAARLSYEANRPRRETDKKTAHLSEFSEARLQDIERLNEIPRYTYSNRRTKTFEHIHKSVVEKFITSRGFGAARMIPDRVGYEYLEITDDRRSDFFRYFDDIRDSNKVESAVPIDAIYYHLHDHSSLDFASPLSFGFIKNRNQVSGFDSHALHKTIFPSVEIKNWKCTKVELVSLLKFGSPRVYVSDELPAMDQLKNATTRTPDSFEEESLESLRQGNDLEVNRSEKEMRMFGSLRASAACLKCHEVERGELLGAFSYRFVPDGSK